MEKTASPAFGFIFYFISTICVLSLGLNAALLVAKDNPEFWTTFRLSFKKPPPVSSTDHIRGSVADGITVIDYSDFQCPYCKQMHSELKQLSEKTKIVWVFRHYPLESIHPLAMQSAIASECAGKQGKFWEYADALFENQDQITSETVFADFARRLELNAADFEKCRTSGGNALVLAQIKQADEIEVTSTPTLFVNGKRVIGAVSYEQLAKLAGK
jgi:protein-disulfide isomerase